MYDEKEVERIIQDNKKYLKKFKTWLKEKGLSDKTINSHVSNAALYINDYLAYRELFDMKSGVGLINGFLGDWFIVKCMWSTGPYVKSTAASIKKFYQCMNEFGYVTDAEYDELCLCIKGNIDIWVDRVERYNDMDIDDWY